jgi:hypothetical protein
MYLKNKPCKKHKNPRNCFSQKVRYKDHQLAVDALRTISNRRRTDLSNFGKTSFNQTRVYFHDGCKGWHLTSQESWGVLGGSI